MPSPPPPPPYASKHNIITTANTTPNPMHRQTPFSQSRFCPSSIPIDPSGSRVSTALNITFSPPPLNPHFVERSTSPGSTPTTTLTTTNMAETSAVKQSIPSSMPPSSSSSPTGAEVKLGVCCECGVRITNVASACQALGCIYHNDCFVCCFCHRTLRGKTFYKDQDKIYCEEDYLYCGFQRTAEKCIACGHIIAQTILQAMGKSYHPGCFRCCVCNKCMDGQPFTLDKQDRIYCVEDYYLVSAPTCAVCGNGILPDENSDEVIRVVAMDKEFHIDCYRCEDCKIPLTDEGGSGCFPLSEALEGGAERVHILCLPCRLLRIGATPAAGQKNLELHRRGSGSSISSDLGSSPRTSVTGVYSPTPTSFGIASIAKSTPFICGDTSSLQRSYQPRRHGSTSSYLNQNGNLYR